jgi:hypothetical protein
VPDGTADARAYVQLALAGRDSGRQVPFAVRDLRSGQVAGDGTVRDSACYSVTAAEWPAVRGRLESRLSMPV